MQFGKVENPNLIDFKLPETCPQTFKVLEETKSSKTLNIYIGCAKWNKNDLKGFYPKGVKDELIYYSSQFNAIELNTTFYNSPSKNQVNIWKNKVSNGFKFFPKIPQTISHYQRLVNTEDQLKSFCESVRFFESNLGTVFLQMHENFSSKDVNRLEKFIYNFPKDIPLAVEVRNNDWFSNLDTSINFYKLLQSNNVTNIIVDTAGRRDLMHMRLTNSTAFIRFVGANVKSDYERLDSWVKRLVEWKEAGLENLYFFVHQNVEEESALLAAHFIKKLNKAFEINLKIPQKPYSILPLFD